MESSSDLDPDILDSLYEHQLKELRELTLKLEDTQAINLCRKWLQVFNKTSEDEKVARNCLCALLCQHLKNDGCLSTPFTELSNCNRNLTQVLANLDETTSSKSRSIQSSLWNESRRSNANLLSQENEILQLRRELHDLRQERAEKEIKIKELTAIIDKCNQCEMENDVVKKIWNLLENLKHQADFEQFWIFSHLFADEDNTKMNHKLTDLDKSFQDILQRVTTSKQSSIQRQLDNVVESREKLLRRHQQELRIEKLRRRLKMKMVKLQFYSILSRMFIKSRQKTHVQLMDMFNHLEDRYQNILLKLTNQQ